MAILLLARDPPQSRDCIDRFLFPVEAGEIDNFVGSLRELDKTKAGEAVLRIAH